MKIRPTIHTDAAGIARVHVDTWRAAYRGIVPDDYLASLSYDTRAAFWERTISNPFTPTFVHTAEETDGDIVGFASGGPTRDDVPGYEGELYAIYVLPQAQGKGVGHMLVKAVAQTLNERGITTMMLLVLKDNAPSRAFYESMGGILLEGEEQSELGGVVLTEVKYGWPDTKILL